ncbi:hypothetical protein M9H77_08043 [Catharanthus roseus]|uniref:Uncharacterized protein n=1 Tax=Catharanthus roseus TaxID=4058 RepID=A0ACC0BWN5_CATRO|nr:hypothetical protein M9H77_08043 [Catharanthus roseus]
MGSPRGLIFSRMARILSQFLNFLTTTFGESDHRMKAKEEGIGKELNIGFEETSLSLSLNPFLLYREFSFKELKLFLELYASFVTVKVMVSPFICEVAFDIDHMLKCSSPCASLDKQLLVSNRELNHLTMTLSCYMILFSLIFLLLISHRLVLICGVRFISSLDLLLKVVMIRVSCFPWSLCSDFHAKYKGELVENCDFESSFLYAFVKNLDRTIPSIQLLNLVNLKFKFACVSILSFSFQGIHVVAILWKE